MGRKKTVRSLVVAISLLLAVTARTQESSVEGQRATTQKSPAYVYVMGGVRSPARLILRRPMPLTKVLACSGGISPAGDKNEVHVYRTVRGDIEPTVIAVDMRAVKKGRADDLMIQPYDIIEVRCKRFGVGVCFSIRNVLDFPVRVIL